MRICWISVSDQLGGSEVALLSMLRGLHAARPAWELQVVLPGEGPLLPEVRAAGAETAVVPMPQPLARLGETAAVRRGWTSAATTAFALQAARAAATLPAYQRRLSRALDRLGAGILHTNGIKAHIVGARVAGRTRPLVWHLHEYVSPRRFTRYWLKRYSARPGAIIANSRSVADDAAGAIAPPHPIQVIHNAVDLAACAPEGPRLDLDAAAGLPPSSALRVGLVATFGRWKGHEVFVAAMREVIARAPFAVRGYLVGGALYDTPGSQFTRDDLRRMIDDRGLSGHVGLTGFTDAAAAMRSLDIVVHASTEPEPFGLVVAEAMACGRPVVTTGSGGTAEFVRAGITALVAPPCDAAALADSIIWLGSDGARRAGIGAAARRFAVEHFSRERMASALAATYEALAARRPS